MTADLLVARGLAKTYTKSATPLVVLNGADLTVRRGEQVAITGASGAGKSTLLHLLGTLDVPDRGDILFEGSSIVSADAAALCRFRNQSLGFVFQFHHLLPDFDALENVMMPALIRRDSHATAKKRAEKVLEEVGLQSRLSHRPSELSGGEQQRVALARALVLEPALLLADEVTGNLDATTAAGIHALLKDLNATRNITQIIVTHNEVWAKSLPRRLVLADGQLTEAA